MGIDLFLKNSSTVISLFNHYHKKLATLVNQNILLEAKMESMTKDYMDFQKNDTIEAFSVTSTERSI